MRPYRRGGRTQRGRGGQMPVLYPTANHLGGYWAPQVPLQPAQYYPMTYNQPPVYNHHGYTLISPNQTMPAIAYSHPQWTMPQGYPQPVQNLQDPLVLYQADMTRRIRNADIEERLSDEIAPSLERIRRYDHRMHTIVNECQEQHLMNQKISKEDENKTPSNEGGPVPNTVSADAGGIAFLGPYGNSSSLLTQVSATTSRPSLDPERRGTRVVKDRSLPEMDDSEVDELLRGYPGRLATEYKVSFPESAATDEFEANKLPQQDPSRKLWGPQGLLARGNHLDGPPRSEMKTTPLQKVGEIAGKLVSKGRDASLTRRATYGLTKSPGQIFNRAVSRTKIPTPEPVSNIPYKTLLKISVRPGEQMWMLSRVEFLLTMTANNFLLSQKDNGRMSVESVQKIVGEWRRRNRPQPRDFLFDFATQYELTKLNVDRFIFHGRESHSHVNKMTLLNSWRSLARDLGNRTFSLPDPALKKIVVDGFRLLEMLGGDNEAFIEFREIQRTIAEAAQRSSEDAAIAKNPDERQKKYGVTKRVPSPLLLSTRGLIDDEDEYYNDGIYKGPHGSQHHGHPQT